MFYGKPWVRSDVDFVISEMKQKDMLFHNGIIFYKVSSTVTDSLLQYLYPMAESGSGAVAIGMDRRIVANSNAQFPSDGGKFLLDNSAVNDPIVPIVVFVEGLLQDKHRNKLLFTLAHEISHVVNNVDLDPENAVTPLSPEDLKREMAADTNAVAILGERNSGIETLEFILSVFETPEFREGILNGTTSPEVFATSVNQLKQRAINIVQGA